MVACSLGSGSGGGNAMAVRHTRCARWFDMCAVSQDAVPRQSWSHLRSQHECWCKLAYHSQLEISSREKVQKMRTKFWRPRLDIEAQVSKSGGSMAGLRSLSTRVGSDGPWWREEDQPPYIGRIVNNN